MLPDIFAPKVEAFIGTAGEVRIQMLAEKRGFGFGCEATSSEPGTDRGSKAFLFPMDDLAGQEFFGRALEEVFGGLAAKFEMMRQAAGKIRDFDVEKWASHFERVHHAGAVGLREDSVLQVDFGVKLQSAVHRVVGGAGFPRLDRLAVNFLDGTSGLGESRKVGGFQCSEPNGIPKLRGVIEPAQGAFDFKIEADVFVRNRESRSEEAKGLMDGTRDSFFVKRSEAQRAEGIVAGEEFVTAITAEGHGDFGPGESAKQPSGKEGAVALGLVESIENLGQGREGSIQAERVGMVVGF